MSRWVNRTLVQLAEGATNNVGTTSTVNFTAATAGNLLVAVASGSVTSTTPTGWTLGTSAIGSTGHYVWYKTATAGESSFSTTHNGSGYANAFTIWEFPQGSTFVKGNGTAGLASGTANPTISSMTGTNLFFASLCQSYPYTTFNGSSIAWGGGLTVDTYIDAPHVAHDGYWTSIAYIEQTYAAFGPTPTVTDPNGAVAAERLTWAINVPSDTSVSLVANITPFDFSGATGTITVPAGVTSSHLGIIMAANANNYVDGAVMALPAGWTKQADHPQGANNSCVYLWTGLGKATAGQTVTVSNTGSLSNFTVYAVWLDTGGKDIAIVGSSTGGRAGTSSANTVIPGITTTGARQSVIMVATERTTATGTAVNSVSGVSPTPVQDYYFENTASTATSFLVEHFTQNAAGATGNATVTYSGASGNGFGMMFGITTATVNPKISTLTDDFTTQNNTKWVYAAAATVSGGRLSTTPNTSYTGNVNSAVAYDLTESAIFLQVPQRANVGNSGTETFIQLFDTGLNVTSKNSLLIDVMGSNILFQYRNTAGTSTNVASVSYSATAHAWWRIRAASGTVYWDTSSDGFNWNNQASWVSTIPMTSMKVIMGSGYQGTEPSPGTALFDNVNVAPVGAAMTTLTDDFATKDTNKWYWATPVTQTNNQVNIGVNTNYDGIISNSFYNLTNSSSTVNVVQAPNIGNGSTELQYILRVDSTAAVFWSISGGYATCYTKSAGVTTQQATMPYNPKTHKYLRIAHDGTYVNFQYSYTGNTWATLYAWTPTIAITGMQVYLIAGYWGTETSPGTAIMDNYNIVPADPAQTVYNGTTEITTTLTVYNGTTEVAVAKTEIMRPGTSVAAMSSATPQNPFFVAHRGGSADWAEHSMRGNTQSVYLNMDAIEISLSRTSDGVWFGLHDQYLNRTSPSASANYDPQAHTWAEVSAFTCAAPSGGDATFGAQPYCKLTDALAAYASTHVIFLDPKYVSSTYYSELLNIMDANGGTSRFIAKFSGGGEQWSVAAKARGYKSWGYFYATDVDGGTLNSTTAAKYDFLGMEYNVATSYWTNVKSYGKPVIAHIAPNAAGVTSGLSQGAVGVMVSGVRSAMATYRP